MKKFKICVIGAGSVGFTKNLISDILKVPEFGQGRIEIALNDINEHNLAMIRQIIESIINASHLKTVVTATTDRKEALKDARYIINCSRIGGLEAFAHDINIPLKYGVDQCVGDTICAGGLMYAQRGVHAVLEFCQDIREVAEPNALLLNYASPMAMMTWACIEYGKINAVGLCHGVQNSHRQIASALREPDIRKVEVFCTGINHQTWFTGVKWDGREVGRDELVTAFEAHRSFSKEEKVRIDVLKRFGYYSTESNGHLSEYLPWYRKRPEEITKWIASNDWIHGETGGYLRYCTENRNWFESDFPEFLEDANKGLQGDRTDEHASYIIEALETGRTYRGHFNVRNNGIISNLPDDCIVESPGFIDHFGFNMVAGIELPLACAATCSASINVQRMGVVAAVTGNVDLLKQAVLHDPLVGAICTPDEVWQMVDEMLVAQAEWLPQYAESIPAAEERLKTSNIATKEWAGAARAEVRTVEQLRAAQGNKKSESHGLGSSIKA